MKYLVIITVSVDGQIYVIFVVLYPQKYIHIQLSLHVYVGILILEIEHIHY